MGRAPKLVFVTSRPVLPRRIVLISSSSSCIKLLFDLESLQMPFPCCFYDRIYVSEFFLPAKVPLSSFGRSDQNRRITLPRRCIFGSDVQACYFLCSSYNIQN